MKIKSILICLLCGMLLFITACGNNGAKTPATNAEADQSLKIKFTDLAGKEIVLNKRPERIFLGFYISNYLLVGGADSIDTIVGMCLHDWSDYRYGEYQVFSSAFPQIKEDNPAIADVGSAYAGDFSLEKLFQIKPDVVLFAPFQYEAFKEQIPNIEKAGIKVVLIDYNSQTLEAHSQSTRILGMLLGKEERAEEIIKSYEDALKDIDNRLAKLEGPKKTVYCELGSMGPKDFGNSFGDNYLWGGVITRAGGNNIASGVVEKHGPLNPEYILKQNPDVIVFSGNTWPNDPGDRIVMGFGVEDKQTQERLKLYTARPGWNNITAVKNHQIYAVDHGGLRTMIDYVYPQFLAKALYPDLFEDIEPIENLKAFYKKYLPEVEIMGNFMTKMEVD